VLAQGADGAAGERGSASGDLRQREVSGVQHDELPNAFLPPFVRSATIP